MSHRERPDEIAASVLGGRQPRTERRREHIAAPALKERVAGLKAIRDQARADADHAQAMAKGTGQPAITAAMVRAVARTTRARIRVSG